MQKVWNILWKQFECATNEFNAYIDGGIPAIAQQKIAKFIKEWDKLKEQAMKFDELMQNPIEPIEIKLPSKKKSFCRLGNIGKNTVLKRLVRPIKAEKNRRFWTILMK